MTRFEGGPFQEAVTMSCNAATEAFAGVLRHRAICVECAKGLENRGYSWKDCPIGEALHHLHYTMEEEFRNVLAKAYAVMFPTPPPQPAPITQTQLPPAATPPAVMEATEEVPF